MSTLGDRRRRVRHEVVGALWGALDVDERAELVDISERGALVSAPAPRDVDALQSLVMTHNGRDIPVNARVRHVRRVSGNRYLLGMEFLASSSELNEAGE